MKTYNCSCGQILFFESVTCTSCQLELGFLPDLLCMSSLQLSENGLFQAEAAGGKIYKKCENYSRFNVCNWMIPAEEENELFCVSCRLNLMIPDLSIPQNAPLWGLLEAAKRRFVYSALQLKLPLANRSEDPDQGLAFRFLGDIANPDGSVQRAITEHDHGLITLNIEEADDAVREKNRLGMNEPYRTLLGHFRHESGHYYWDRLVLDTPFVESYRNIFGDERQDYDESMQRYYANGAPANWQETHISAYATMHPWEDWAETWAHFLHIQDTLEVAADFGLISSKFQIVPKSNSANSAPSGNKPFDQILEKWSELTLALNSINRSMGLRDLYPFVLSKPVVEKLRFVSEVIAGSPTPVQTS